MVPVDNLRGRLGKQPDHLAAVEPLHSVQVFLCIADKAFRQLYPLLVGDHDGVSDGEIPLHPGHTDVQQAARAAEGFDGSCIHNHLAVGRFAVKQPKLIVGETQRPRCETGADLLSGQTRGQHSQAVPPGNDRLHPHWWPYARC